MPKSLPKRKHLYQTESSRRSQSPSPRWGSTTRGGRRSGKQASSAPELINRSYIEERETKFPVRKTPKPLPVRRDSTPTFSVHSLLKLRNFVHFLTLISKLLIFFKRNWRWHFKLYRVNPTLINQNIARPEREDDVDPDLTIQTSAQPGEEEGELKENQQHLVEIQEHPSTTPDAIQETSEQALQPSVVSRRLPSIYDCQIDPPDFEQEKKHYPHIKVFPDPAQPEEIALSELAYGWHIIGASRRGYGHAYDGKYREDDFEISHICLWQTRTMISLVAIADGVGSKAHARYGAHAAVEGAISKIVQEDILLKLIDITKFLVMDGPEITSEQKEQVFHLLEIAMQASIERVREQALYLNSQDRDLHSTLQLFLLIPFSEQHLFLASTQVGDGALFARKARDSYTRDTWFHVQTQQIQAIGNQVFPLLYSNKDHWRNAFQCDKYDNIRCILAMTDGTTDDIAPPYPTPGDPDPDPDINVESFYSMLKHTVEQSEHTQLAVALCDFLSYRKPQSYDDRTVIYIYQDE